MSKYVVKNENTLCYRQEGSELLGVLAGSVLRGGHDWRNGPVSVDEDDLLRDATLDDFKFFRVDPTGHIA